MGEQWVVRWDNVWLPQDASAPRSVQTLEAAGKWPTEEAARERLAGTGWVGKAAVERIDVTDSVTRIPSGPHDGNAEALLREADAWIAMSGSGMARQSVDVIRDLIAFFLAERERVKRVTAAGCAATGQAVTARGHLRAVLDFMWPGDAGGPTVVQKARAFLAGEGHADSRGEASSFVELKQCIEAVLAFKIPANMPMHHVPQIVEDAVRKIAETNAVLLRELDEEREVHAQTKRCLDHAKQMMASLTDQRVLAFVDASLKHGTTELVPKAELDAERKAHEKDKRERNEALETIRVLRLRIDGIADVVWKDLSK